MGFYIIQAGSNLKRMTTGGTLTTLTLPTGVSIDSSKRMRAAVLNNVVVVVNSPSENLSIDRDDHVRILCPKPPATAPTLSAVAGGSLSGSFRVKDTFIVKDEFGNLIAESEFGPVSAASATLASQYLKTASVPISTQTVSARRQYRTTTGPGSVYYQWADVEGNTVTNYQDDLSDAGLALIAAPTDLGTPPTFELIAAWKSRLWGKSADNPDTLYQGANGKTYAFPCSRTIVVPPSNYDAKGITGLLTRKDELGVGKSNSFHKIIGTNENNFTRVVVADSVGVWAADSCVVIQDMGYFLGNPFGIYTWGPGGITNITNDKVKLWFESDTYFNRARFDQAVGFYDPILHGYVLLLSAAGSTDLDRWIFYDISTKTFWGPHKTGAFTPTGGATLRDANDLAIPVWLASDGKLYKPQATKTDGASTAVDFDVTTNAMGANTPTVMKHFGRAMLTSKIQAGGTLTVTPTVGKLNASPGTAQSHDLTKGWEELARLGNGEFLTLRFRENTAGQAVSLYGVEIPFFEIGQR